MFPRAKAGMLNASLTGAVPLRPQSSSLCFSVHTLARKQAGKKKRKEGLNRREFQEK